MTDPGPVTKAKTIKALLEAIDEDDDKDARQAIEMIKALLGTEK